MTPMVAILGRAKLLRGECNSAWWGREKFQCGASWRMNLSGRKNRHRGNMTKGKKGELRHCSYTIKGFSCLQQDTETDQPKPMQPKKTGWNSNRKEHMAEEAGVRRIQFTYLRIQSNLRGFGSIGKVTSGFQCPWVTGWHKMAEDEDSQRV